MACLCPNLVSVHFYAIHILHFKFPIFLFTTIEFDAHMEVQKGKIKVQHADEKREKHSVQSDFSTIEIDHLLTTSVEKEAKCTRN